MNAALETLNEENYINIKAQGEDILITVVSGSLPEPSAIKIVCIGDKSSVFFTCVKGAVREYGCINVSKDGNLFIAETCD